MKIDLHVHTKFSKHPNEWILRKLGAQESYTEPSEVYRIAKARGMDAVTITDHNSIEGCLAIAHLEDTFISCEYTTYFLDGCKIHVLCYDITPQQHFRIQEIRSDIVTFVEYLKREGIVHSLAHAFFSPNSRLTPEHVGQLLELFDTWEINGAKDAWANESLKALLVAARPDHKLTAGSDDHSSLTIAHIWTEVPGATTIREFLQGIETGKTIVRGQYSTPHTLAWNIFSVGWQWLKYTKMINGFSGIIDRYLLPPESHHNESLARKLWLNTRVISPRNWGRALAFSFISRQFAHADGAELSGLSLSERWFRILESITSKYVGKFGNTIISGVARKEFQNVFSNVGLPVALYLILAPFFVAFGNFAIQRKLARDTLDRFGPQETHEIKVAKFTDTFGTVDGVSKTLDEQLCEAVRTGKEYTIISCVGPNNRKGLKVFEPVGMIDAPHFEQQKLCWPPVLKMLEYCYEERFTHIQAATPGPVGMAGMIVAKTLGLPFQAVYHTQIPEFVAKATDDPFLEGLAWKYCLWFYDTADMIFAPSEHTQNDLIEHGIKPEKIKTYPRGVDTSFFNPGRRTAYWEGKWNVEPGTVKALYVGRVSWEKNLPLLARAFKKAVDRIRDSAHLNGDSKISLLVVGEGGYWEQMKQDCRGYPVILTGSLQGEELAQAFASADFFVFPSTTDTYGRVVMESMSSGIPCIVTDVGGPVENVTDHVNGMVVPGEDETALVEALLKMAFKVDRRTMAQRARESVETKSFAETFDRYWALYGQ